MSFEAEEIVGAPLSETDAARFLVAADDFLARGLPRLAASALDRAYALVPDDEHVARQRLAVLDDLAFTEHGLVFRYVPAGIFSMGSAHGDPDERPVHPVRLGEYWIAQAPTTWAAYCDLLGWYPPPGGHPPESHVFPTEAEETEHDMDTPFLLREANKIRRQYCETETKRAVDHHAHDPNLRLVDADGNEVSPGDTFGRVAREHPTRPLAYDRKPMVGVRRMEVRYLVERLTTDHIAYALPTEAEWEKAARGGLAQRRWSWGDEPPTRSRCDFDRFGDFRLTDPYAFPPNGYGLHGMCGGVSEWTSSWYDALAYRLRAERGLARDPVDERPDGAEEPCIVLRGGSWSDCATAITTSFRTARGSTGLRASSPNVGFRLVRKERSP